MPTLNARQQAQVNAIANFKAGARGVVEQVELTLAEYIGKDSFSPNNLEFFLNAMKRTPRLQTVFRKILPSIVPVQIKGSAKTKFKVTNVELTKKLKLKARQEVKAFTALALGSLLDHPSIKVEIEFDWTKKSASLATQMANLMKNEGITKDQLMKVVDLAVTKSKAA
jgi:hypothetical protein